MPMLENWLVLLANIYTGYVLFSMLIDTISSECKQFQLSFETQPIYYCKWNGWTTLNTMPQFLDFQSPYKCVQVVFLDFGPGQSTEQYHTHPQSL